MAEGFEKRKRMIDLHCHTTASDGLVSPSNIIRQAAIEGISLIAIADHDTVNGLEEAFESAKKEDVSFIPAVELSVDCEKGDFHLLGYGIQYRNQSLRTKLEELKHIREERIMRIVDKLNQARVQITQSDVQNEITGAAPGKPHVARVLVSKGYAPDVQTAIITYLNKGKPGYVRKEKIRPEDAFELIKCAGGVAVLAHPASLNRESHDEYIQIIQRYISMGLAGIEVYSNIHNNEDVKFFSDIARQYNLIATGGSDFHSNNGERLGYYGACRPIPTSCSRDLLRLVKN